MDMLIGVIFVLVLGLAVAQFFITAGAFKRPGGGAGRARGEGGGPVLGATGSEKSSREAGNPTDSGDSGGDGGGD